MERSGIPVRFILWLCGAPGFQRHRRIPTAGLDASSIIESTGPRSHDSSYGAQLYVMSIAAKAIPIEMTVKSTTSR
jgi:hypothetical protein